MTLGTKVNKDLYEIIGKKVILNDPKSGEPIEVEVMDIISGMVFYEHYSGETSSIPVEEFEKQWQSTTI